MQLTIDTTIDTAKEMALAIDFLQTLVDARQISKADNPATGAEPVKTLRQELAERGMPPPPTLEMPAPATPDPAAVFGGAAAPVPPPPPAVPSADATPPPPPAPPTVSPVPPVPGAATPPTAVAPPAPGAAPVELDSKGLPWDIRIHAQNRAKNADGGWRAKRGVNDDALVARVEAELRAVQALPAPVPPSNVVPISAAVAAAAPETAPPMPSAAVVFGASAQGEIPIPGPAPADFPALMLALTPGMSQGRVTQALITEACAASGIPSLPLLAARPDLIPAVFDFIRARAQL